MRLRKILEIGIINTLRLNLYYYPLSEALKFPILASRHLRIRQLGGTLKHLNPKTASIRLGFDSVGIFDNKKMRSIWEISNESKIIIKGSLSFGNGFKLSVGGGTLTIGDNLRITGNSTIICNKYIEFGDNDLLSWDVLIMDTDFHKIYCNHNITNQDKKVIIQDKVWIGCRVTVLKGSIIPKGSIIASGSIVSKELINEYSIYGGNPLKILKSDINWEL